MISSLTVAQIGLIAMLAGIGMVFGGEALIASGALALLLDVAVNW